MDPGHGQWTQMLCCIQTVLPIDRHKILRLRWNSWAVSPVDNSDKLEKLAWQYFENVSQHSWGDLVTFELQLSNAIYIGRISSHILMCWCFFVIKSMILDKSYLIVVLTERLVPTTRLQFLASRNSCRSLIATTTTIHYCPVLTTKTDYNRLPLWCY